MINLKEGEFAPDFELPDSNNKLHKLSSFRGKNVILYFYPKDDTPGCTKQACDLRDNFHKLTETGAEVIGISTDSVESHQNFVKKYAIPFLLLSDSNKQVAKLYNVIKKILNIETPLTTRTTFIIDKGGKIKKILENVDPNKHISEILEYL